MFCMIHGQRFPVSAVVAVGLTVEQGSLNYSSSAIVTASLQCQITFAAQGQATLAVQKKCATFRVQYVRSSLELIKLLVARARWDLLPL